MIEMLFWICVAAILYVVTNHPQGPGLIYETALATQTLFYVGVLAGALLLRRNRKVRLLNFAYVFSLMNAAALVGLVYFVFGKRNVWVRGE